MELPEFLARYLKSSISSNLPLPLFQYQFELWNPKYFFFGQKNPIILSKQLSRKLYYLVNGVMSRHLPLESNLGIAFLRPLKRKSPAKEALHLALYRSLKWCKCDYTIILCAPSDFM